MEKTTKHTTYMRNQTGLSIICYNKEIKVKIEKEEDMIWKYL